MNPTIELDEQYCAHNYHPLPVVLVHGDGTYLWDDEGKNYLDMMSGCSAVNFGHAHPRLIKVLTEQAQGLAVVPRAYHTELVPLFLEKMCLLTGQDQALAMNTGAEAVETALKAARKWGYKVKGIARDQTEIIVCQGNSHGRTIATLGLSSEELYRDGFGPFPTGFKQIPYGDGGALENAITPYTAAFLVEPIQGQAGVIVPPDEYLAECTRICQKHNVLLICDEAQTALGRTGKMLACEHEDVQPDGLILGEALGGGLLPISLFLAREDVMGVFTLGDHGSTFGGNPLAAAVALEVIHVLGAERLPERAAKLGSNFLTKLRGLTSPLVKKVRGRGLLIGVEIDPAKATARMVCEQLARHGILTSETRKTVVRFTPPLTITQDELDWAFNTIKKALAELEAVNNAA